MCTNVIFLAKKYWRTKYTVKQIYNQPLSKPGNVFNQGKSRDKTMADKLMYIPNDKTQTYLFNQWLKSLDTQLNEPTNQI